MQCLVVGKCLIMLLIRFPGLQKAFKETLSREFLRLGVKNVFLHEHRILLERQEKEIK